MNGTRNVSKGVGKALSLGLQGFLWYLADTIEAAEQEFRLEPGKRTQHVIHSQNSGVLSREYDVTVAQSENLISGSVVIRRDGSCGTMMLMEEYRRVKSNV